MLLCRAPVLARALAPPRAARLASAFALPVAPLLGRPLASRLHVAARWGALTAPVQLRSSLQVTAARVRRLTAAVATDAAGAGADAGAVQAAARLARNRRLVGWWLATTAGAVFVMVVLGGVTRLTRSGLSIVEWRATGEVWPTSDEQWAAEFDKYKAFPEWQRVNRHMSLDEFKPIYFMEWFHRQWGRGIGLLFAGPLLYFLAARRIPPGLGGRLGLLLGLGAAQGGVGWWMVKSGLEHERFNEYSIPRVSPYRLATHLGFAFSLYSILAWTAIDLLRTPPAALPAGAKAAAAALRPASWTAAGLIFVTVASGAFVAGNDAGHAYNDWPLFAGRVIPEQIWEPLLGARNFFENTATVQFDHRLLAYASLGAVGAIHAKAGRLGGHAVLPPAVRSSSRLLGLLVGAQVALGVSTLMLYVPVPLAAAHQGGAMVLLTGAINLLHAISQAVKAPTAAGASEAAVKAAVKTPAAMAATAAVAGVVALLGDADGSDDKQ